MFPFNSIQSESTSRTHYIDDTCHCLDSLPARYAIWILDSLRPVPIEKIFIHFMDLHLHLDDVTRFHNSMKILWFLSISAISSLHPCSQIVAHLFPPSLQFWCAHIRQVNSRKLLRLSQQSKKPVIDCTQSSDTTTTLLCS
jgi:hypothetical protein